MKVVLGEYPELTARGIPRRAQRTMVAQLLPQEV